MVPFLAAVPEGSVSQTRSSLPVFLGHFLSHVRLDVSLNRRGNIPVIGIHLLISDVNRCLHIHYSSRIWFPGMLVLPRAIHRSTNQYGSDRITHVPAPSDDIQQYILLR